MLILLMRPSQYLFMSACNFHEVSFNHLSLGYLAYCCTVLKNSYGSLYGLNLMHPMYLLIGLHLYYIYVSISKCSILYSVKYMQKLMCMLLSITWKILQLLWRKTNQKYLDIMTCYCLPYRYLWTKMLLPYVVGLDKILWYLWKDAIFRFKLSTICF